MMSDIERTIRDVLNATEVTELTTVEDEETLTQELVEAINLVVGR
jgi:flagellar basal body-associated protein FliL